LPLRDAAGDPLSVMSLELPDVMEQPVHVGNHCYACTAGSGSSCGGALVA
jgi:hypothetical protein